MKVFSIGGLAIGANVFFGFFNTFNPSQPFWSIFGAIALVVGGVLLGMSIMEQFTRH
jgi:hypothetical protein